MKRSDSIKEMALALVKAQAEIKAAVKDSTNPHFRSKYADLGSVIEAVKAPLLKNGIVFIQPVGFSETGVSVETILLHTSGEWIGETLHVPVSKQDAQGVGSAISYGRRYGLQSICGVPAEDDDGNAATASTNKVSRITPNAGAGDDLDQETKRLVETTRDHILVALNEGKDWDAYALCESLTDEQMAEKLYLWSLLDSKQRSRIKKQADIAKKQKAANG